MTGVLFKSGFAFKPMRYRFECTYLLEVKRIPLTPPNVDIATKIGIRKAKYPNILSAKVTATASLPNREKKEKVSLIH